MSELTHVRVSLDIKSELESIKEKYRHVSSASDAVRHLIDENKRLGEELSRSVEEEREKKKRRGLEDLKLGHQRKSALVDLQQSLGLHNPNQLIDFLLEHYHNSPHLDKSTFIFYGELMKNV